MARIILLALALIIAVGLSTWALAWAYRQYVVSSAEVTKARYNRDEVMVEEAETEVAERRG